MSRVPADVELDAAAESTERLAVLLEAGLAPGVAWRHLARDDPASLAARVADGGADELADRLAAAVAGSEHPGAPALAAVWRVATDAGAPLATALLDLGSTLRDLAQSAREVETALAGSRATSRIVLALPPLGLLLGAVLGLDVVGALSGSPVGAVSLAAGAALVVAGARWNRRLLAAASEREPAPGLAAELVAIGLAGGLAPPRALDLARRALDEAALDVGDDLDAVVHRLDFARDAGVPAGAVLRSEARAARRRARSAGARRATELGSRLVLPLGVCILPAFVLVGVVPIGLAIVSSTAPAW